MATDGSYERDGVAMSKEHFPISEFEARQARVRSRMAEQGIDLLLVISPVNINWLIGAQAKAYQVFQCLFFPLDPASPKVMTLRLGDVAEVLDTSLADEVQGWGGRHFEDPIDRVEKIMNEHKWKGLRIGVEFPDYYLSVRNYKKLMARLEAFGPVIDATMLVERLKWAKSAVELDYVRQAARIADIGISTISETLKAGMTEREVAAVAHGAMMAAGGESPASPMNFVSGERTCYAHGLPTDRVLLDGDFMHIEFGGQVRKYCSTIARHFTLGTPSDRALEVHDALIEACDAVIDYIRPGVRGQDVHEVATKVLRKRGLEAYNLHTTGYGIAPGFPPSWGEGMNLFFGGEDLVEAGMVLSVEPPVFIHGEGIGGRIIDCVVVTDNGCELLSKIPRDLIRR